MEVMISLYSQVLGEYKGGIMGAIPRNFAYHSMVVSTTLFL